MRTASRVPSHVTELRRAIPFLLLPLLLAVAGCSLLPWELPGVDASPRPDAEQRAELEARYAAWTASGIDNYVLEVQFVCFCPSTDPLTVTVLDGQVVDVQPADPSVRWYPLTVDAIYERALSTMDGGGTAAVTWRDDGVPAQLLLDPVPEAIDDELDILVQGFTLGG